MVVFSLPSLSSEKQILRHVEWASRDFYYIHLDEPEEVFEVREYVGGEHENEYNFLGFAGDTFLIVVRSVDDGEPTHVLRGKGYQAQSYKREESGIIGAYVVTVDSEHTWITIGVSAHPAAEYVLVVKKA